MNSLKNIILFFSIIVVSCSSKEDLLFKNPSSEQTGLNFTNSITETNDLNILDYLYYYNGGGVAIGDINNDNLPDVFLSGNQVKNKLFLNKGNLKFEDISETSNTAGNRSWSTGIVMVDINADGWLDIYVCNAGNVQGDDQKNELFINNGDLTFTEKS